MTEERIATVAPQIPVSTMNPKLNFIFQRRSIRSYHKDEVTEQQVRDILEAAMAAPSAMAKDPFHFIVIRQKQRLREVAKILPHGKMLRNAAVGIVVCGDIDQAHDRQESYMLQDCSAAIENILLAATALGIGSCWLGIHPREERMGATAELFSLPDHVIPISAIALGKPREMPEARTRFTTDNIHFEQWTS